MSKRSNNKEKVTVESEVAKPKTQLKSKVSITAQVNAKLPDGTFVQKGKTVEVLKEYADRLVSEKDKRFIIKG